MTLLKTSILSFIATGFRVLSGLVLNKLVAVYAGPGGLALIGQFQNFIQIAVVFAQGATANGVVKYMAEYREDEAALRRIAGSALFITLACGAAVGLAILAASGFLAQWILHDASMQFAFVLLGGTIVFAALNSLCLSVLNGMKMLRSYVGVVIGQSLLGLALTGALVVFYGVKGALAALALNQAAVFILVAILAFRGGLYRKLRPTPAARDRETMGRLARFAAMAATSIVLTPASMMIIRTHIGDTIGWTEAGFWQAMIYISQTYLMVVTTTLSIYYLPRLSEITDKAELRREVAGGYKVIMPFVIAAGAGLYLLRDWIIMILFSPEFTPMRDLFLFQVMGDTMKMAAWLVAFLLLAKAMTKRYIASEIVFSTNFVILSLVMVHFYGVIGVTYAYCINTALYVPVAFLLVRKELF